MKIFFQRKKIKGSLAHLSPCQHDGKKLKNLKDPRWSHLGKKVATSMERTLEPKFGEFKSMGPTAKGPIFF